MDQGERLSGQPPYQRPDLNLETDSDVSGEDPEDIRQGIEETRAQMTETVDAIEAKLDPNRLKAEAKEAVRDATIGRVEAVVNDVQNTAQDMMDSVENTGASLWDTVKSNPIPSAMVAIGLGWLVMKSRGSDHQTMGRRQNLSWRGGGYQYPQYPYRSFQGGYGSERFGAYGYPTYGGQYATGTERGDQGQGQGQGMMDQAQDTAQHLADQAQQQFGNMTDQVGNMADQAQQQFSQLADQAQYQAGQLQSQLMSTMHQNPLAVGAIAFGLGLAAGLAVPETRQEDQLFGSTSDQLTNKAEQAASDKVEQLVGQMSGSGSSQSTQASQSS